MEGAPSARSRKALNLIHERLDESIDDILVAAGKLMQLSDDDNNNHNDDCNNGNDDVVGKRMRDSFSGEEADQRQPSKETFGDDIEVVVRPKKKKKYRSLADIYRVTKPIITHP